MTILTATLTERPDLLASFWSAALLDAWPAFMLEDPTANLYFGPGAFDAWHDWVLVAWDERDPATVIARACSVPFSFGPSVRGRVTLPDGGWDTVVRWADTDRRLGRVTTAASALEIVVHPEHQGRGLSGRMVRALRDNARHRGATVLFAPVRPSRKHLEPHVPMQEYVARRRKDGLPFDAWLRVHVRAGGQIVTVARTSMTIAGDLIAWRDWTGLPFDQDGETVVPGALVPVQVSQQHGYAVYVEPNVWVRHDL